jgi:aminopeptidase
MINFDGLRAAAARMLKVNMNLADGEKLAFVTDIPAPIDWSDYSSEKLTEMSERSLMAKRIYELMLEDFPACKFDFLSFPITGQNGTEPPMELASKFLEYDVLILMTTYSLSHTNARAKACKAGVRIASMPGIEAEMFAPGGPMAADYIQIASETVKWAEIITGGSDVHITTPFGTNLSFSIAGRKGRADTGLIHARGGTGNLPAGEAFTAPVEGTARGRLVVPAGWYPGLKADMTLVFEQGYVTQVLGGGEVGAFYTNKFAFGDETKKHRRNCAELGIGTNPNARKPDNVLEAEKILGTIHVAVGDSSHMGGVNESDLHEDFVLTSPVLVIDGQKVMG